MYFLSIKYYILLSDTHNYIALVYLGFILHYYMFRLATSVIKRYGIGTER